MHSSPPRVGRSTEHPSQRKRVGILTWDFSAPKTGFAPGVAKSKGGLGRAMRWIAESLASGGIPVAVGTPFAADDLQTPDWNEEALYSLTLKRGGHLLFSFLMHFSLRRWIADNDLSVLLAPCGPGGILLLRKPKGVKLCVVCYHTYAQQASAVPAQWWKKIFIPLEKCMLRRADTILCYSADTCRVLQQQYGLPRDRIEELPQIFEVDRWLEWRDEPKVVGRCVCIARLEKRKGVDQLLDDAWEQVRRQCPQANLIIVGDGVQRRFIDRAVRESDKTVQRQSSLPITELIPLVKSAQLLLCPSYLEGFGLAAAEAMACGTTVIGSDVDGLRSLITSGETGWLVPGGDAGALADGIVSLLTNEGLRTRLADKARDSIRQRFNKEQAISALLRSISRLQDSK